MEDKPSFTLVQKYNHYVNCSPNLVKKKVICYISYIFLSHFKGYKYWNT